MASALLTAWLSRSFSSTKPKVLAQANLLADRRVVGEHLGNRRPRWWTSDLDLLRKKGVTRPE